MNILKQVRQLDDLIRQLHKMESKMRAGQIIDAWRELMRVIAMLERSRETLIEETEGKLDEK